MEFLLKLSNRFPERGSTGGGPFDFLPGDGELEGYGTQRVLMLSRVSGRYSIGAGRGREQSPAVFERSHK
jgi:hypothetical protein